MRTREEVRLAYEAVKAEANVRTPPANQSHVLLAVLLILIGFMVWVLVPELFGIGIIMIGGGVVVASLETPRTKGNLKNGCWPKQSWNSSDVMTADWPSLANALNDTDVVAAHVERHRDDLLVKFHADLFLGFGHAGDTSLLALEGARDDFDDAADLNTAGDGLGLQVWQDVFERASPGSTFLAFLSGDWLIPRRADGSRPPSGR